MMNWEKTNKRLQLVLRKEISIRQEILSNLSQQEYMLFIGDIALKEEFKEKNNDLVHRLKALTKRRGHLTRHLFAYISPNTFEDALEESLDSTQKIEEETILLYRKVRTLVERMQKTHLRIKAFYEMAQWEGAVKMSTSIMHPKLSCKKENKKPILIAVDDSKDFLEQSHYLE